MLEIMSLTCRNARDAIIDVIPEAGGVTRSTFIGPTLYNIQVELVVAAVQYVQL